MQVHLGEAPPGPTPRLRIRGGFWQRARAVGPDSGHYFMWEESCRIRRAHYRRLWFCIFVSSRCIFFPFFSIGAITGNAWFFFVTVRICPTKGTSFHRWVVMVRTFVARRVMHHTHHLMPPPHLFDDILSLGLSATYINNVCPWTRRYWYEPHDDDDDDYFVVVLGRFRITALSGSRICELEHENWPLFARNHLTLPPSYCPSEEPKEIEALHYCRWRERLDRLGILMWSIGSVADRKLGMWILATRCKFIVAPRKTWGNHLKANWRSESADAQNVETHIRLLSSPLFYSLFKSETPRMYNCSLFITPYKWKVRVDEMRKKRFDVPRLEGRMDVERGLNWEPRFDKNLSRYTQRAKDWCVQETKVENDISYVEGIVVLMSKVLYHR